MSRQEGERTELRAFGKSEGLESEEVEAAETCIKWQTPEEVQGKV